jgi:hypothetical protein
MNFILAHPAVFSIAAYWIFSALVGGMPFPKESSSSGYTWAYNSLHILAGNVTAVMTSKFSGVLGAGDKVGIQNPVIAADGSLSGTSATLQKAPEPKVP